MDLLFSKLSFPSILLIVILLKVRYMEFAGHANNYQKIALVVLIYQHEPAKLLQAGVI